MPGMSLTKGEKGYGGGSKKGKREHTLAKQRLHLFLSIFWEEGKRAAREREREREDVCMREGFGT